MEQKENSFIQNTQISATKLRSPTKPLTNSSLQLIPAHKTTFFCQDHSSLLSNLFPGSSIIFQREHAGLFNSIYVYQIYGLTEFWIILRQNSTKTRKYIDRQYEKTLSVHLCSAGLFPQIHDIQKEFMITGFLQGKTLSYPSETTGLQETCLDPALSLLIAQKMNFWHKKTKEMLQEYSWISEIEKTTQRIDWTTLSAKKNLKELQAVFYKEMMFLNKELSKCPYRTMQAVCHNDLTPKNIIYNPETKEVHFIDLEFATPGFVLADIARHFSVIVETQNISVLDAQPAPFQLAWLGKYFENAHEVDVVCVRNKLPLYAMTQSLLWLAHTIEFIRSFESAHGYYNIHVEAYNANKKRYLEFSGQDSQNAQVFEKL